jgi:UDP-N-acetylmuramoylalanine-D-glutamate ligase
MISAKRILVIGAGNAGRPAAQLLNYIGNEIRISDKRSYQKLPEKAKYNLKILEEKGVTLELGAHKKRSLKWAEAVFISPNIPRNAEIRELIREEEKKRKIIEVTTRDIGKILNSLIKIPIVGVAGTDGKTTTTNMVGHCVKKLYNPIILSSLQGSLVIEGLIDLLTSNEKINEDLAVLELPHGTIRMTSGIEICVGILTNLTPDHMEEFNSYKDYIKRNLSVKELLHQNGVLILNGDDPILSQVDPENHEIIFYGLNRPKTIKYKGKIYENRKKTHLHVVAEQVENRGLQGSKFLLKVAEIPTLICENCHKINCNCGQFKRKYTKHQTTDIKIKLPSEFNIENTLATIATALVLGFDLETTKDQVESFTSLKGRFEKIAVVNGVDIVIDAAHNPESMETLLTSLEVGGRLIITLDNPDTLTIRDKFKIGKILGKYADLVFVSAKNETTGIVDIKAAAEVLRGANCSEKHLTLGIEEAITKALDNAVKGDLIIHMGPGVVNAYDKVKNDILNSLYPETKTTNSSEREEQS